MKYTIDITGKNTLRVLETTTGVVLILKESETKKPKLGQKFYYIVFNALKGFFCWESVWNNEEMDNALYSSGNCFTEPSEPKGIADGFNAQLMTRVTK